MSVYEGDEFSHALGFEHVNGLVRGPNLSEYQVLHIDGTGMKIVTILVAMCGNNGYDVRCVKGSHNCLEKHARDTWIPRASVERVRENRGEIICFSEALIHGGGRSSGNCSSRQPSFRLHPFLDM